MHTSAYLLSMALSLTNASTSSSTVEDMCDSGISQSPVNIETAHVIVDPTIQDDFSCDFPDVLTGNPVFTGETVQFNTDSHSSCTFQGATFNLAQFHFHWGAHNHEGSEHAFDDTFSPLEMHMVHVNEKYTNSTEALEHDDGFLVVGIMFEPDDSSYANGVVDEVVSNVGAEDVDGPYLTLNMNDLVAVGDDVVSFFEEEEFCTLPGSLTTSPCTPNVRWIVSQHLGKISDDTMDKFRALFESHSHGQSEEDEDDEDDESDDDSDDDEEEEEEQSHETGNFRDIQPLGDREIICVSHF